MPRLSNNEDHDFSNLFQVSFTELQTAGYLSTLGAANQKIIGVVPAGASVRLCAVYIGAAFTGATDIVLNIGTTAATPNEFIAALDVDALTKAAYNTGTPLSTVARYVNNTTSSQPIYMQWGGTFASLTAGAVVIAYSLYNPGRYYNPIT